MPPTSRLIVFAALCVSATGFLASTPRLPTVRRTVTDMCPKKLDGYSAECAIDLKGVMVLLPMATLILPVQEAMAKGGEYGLLEGRLGSMMHPVTMGLLFMTSVYSASLGLKWRQLRTIGEEIKEASSTLPIISTGQVKMPVSETVSVLKSKVQQLKTASDGESISALAVAQRDLELLNGANEAILKIEVLTATRKDLQSQNLRDKVREHLVFFSFLSYRRVFNARTHTHIHFHSTGSLDLSSSELGWVCPF